VSTIQHRGFEVRHAENLREHYALTLRAWLANLDARGDHAVDLAGQARARVWRLFIAASAARFEDGPIQVHQVLAAKLDGGRSGMPLRPSFS
jgi:cyclopropane-fatty-acyl-phospholipid synthase